MHKYRILVVISIIVLSVFSLAYMYKKIWKRWGSVYTLKVNVEDVGSLPVGTSVLMNGVNVGSVKNVYLGSGSVIVELEINKKIKIPLGSEVKITPIGLVGKLTVSIYRPSKITGYLKNGDTIPGEGPTSPTVILDKATGIAQQINNLITELDVSYLGDNLSLFSEKMNKIAGYFSEEDSRKIIEILNNVSNLTESLDSVVDRKKVRSIIDSLDRSSSVIASIFTDIVFKGSVGIPFSKDIKNVDGEMNIEWPFLSLAKKGLFEWKDGYSVMFRKILNPLDLRIGLLYGSAGIEVGTLPIKRLNVVGRVFDLNNINFEVRVNTFLGPFILGAQYLYKLGSVFNIFSINIGFKTD